MAPVSGWAQGRRPEMGQLVASKQQQVTMARKERKLQITALRRHLPAAVNFPARGVNLSRSRCGMGCRRRSGGGAPRWRWDGGGARRGARREGLCVGAPEEAMELGGGGGSVAPE